MHIYLMRHGTAMSGSQHPFEPLSKGGRKGVETAAKFIKKEKLSFDVIVSSPKMRAEETAQIVADAVGYDRDAIVKTDLLKPNGPPEDAIEFLSRYNDKQSILVTGHMPSLPGIAAQLIGLSILVPFDNACLYRVTVDSLPTADGELLLLYTP